MTAQMMLESIIQAMDEKLSPVVQRLDNLEEQIQQAGMFPAGFEEALDASIDAKLSPVVERQNRVEARLDRVEEQLRQFAVTVPETPEVPEAPEEAEVPATVVVTALPVSVEVPESEEQPEYEEAEEYGELNEEEYEECERYESDLEDLLSRLEGMEVRLTASQEQAEAGLRRLRGQRAA